MTALNTRAKPSMDDTSSTVDSLLTSSSSSFSFVPGPGATTGKFLKALGEKSLDLVVSAIVRTRLTAIEQTLEKHPHILKDPVGEKQRQKMNTIYTELEELCGDSIEARNYYSPSVQRRAANLISDITKVTRSVQGQGLLADASPTNQEWESLLARVQRRTNLLSVRETPPSEPAESSSLASFTEISRDEPILSGYEIETIPPNDPPLSSESLNTKSATPRSSSMNNRILVLGAKGVGKSTVVKQILANVLDPSFRYIQDDDEYYHKAIFDNVKALIRDFMIMNNPDSHFVASLISNHRWGSLEDLPLNFMVAMLRQNLAQKQFTGKFKLLPGSMPESSKSYLSSLDKILEPDYIPSQEDYMHVSIPTRGTYETVVSFPELDFALKLCDVGETRSAERMAVEWGPYFQDPVAVLIFVVALSDYDKIVEGTASINRVADSLNLFGYIANLEQLRSTTIILLFNKLDAFEEELADHPLIEFFPYYTGETVQDACKYVEDQFICRLLNKNRPLVIDYICAVDSYAMSETFETVLWPHLSPWIP